MDLWKKLWRALPDLRINQGCDIESSIQKRLDELGDKVHYIRKVGLEPRYYRRDPALDSKMRLGRSSGR